VQYVQFQFKNFKGIGDLTLDIEGPVTTLIGLNESGKTTILEAIFCFSYGAENLDALDPRMRSLRDPERWIPITKRSNFNEKIEISATLKMSSADQLALRNLLKNEADYRVVKLGDTITIRETYEFVNSRLKADGTKKYWTIDLEGVKGKARLERQIGSATPEWLAAVNFLKKRLPRIWYFPNFLFELPEYFLLSNDESQGTAEERDRNRFYRVTFEKILSKAIPGATLDTHLVSRMDSASRADQRSLAAALLDMSSEITATVFSGWKRIFGRRADNQEVMLNARKRDQVPIMELTIRSGGAYYDLSERSLGFRWFFMFLLMTTYRDVSLEDDGSILLLDEPASNLHSSAQAELLKSFEKLSVDCHVVYTTHSHHLINLKWLDAAYVVKNKALENIESDEYLMSNTADRTLIEAMRYRRFVHENPSSTSYFQPVLDLLTYRPSDLEPVPNVILVEGKSDFYILKYFIDVLGVGPDLKLVPGGGSGSLDTLIGLHIGWGKSFVVLLDGDSAGIREAERYAENFGKIVVERTVLMPAAIGDPKIIEIEDLLSKDDAEALISVVFPPAAVRPSAKKALFQSVSELYALRQSVTLTPATLTRVADLLTRLKALLDSQV
jgi:predicted ATP-dependent endonuclease of OLD family